MSYKHLKFPEGSKFFVTGGAGFIGSNLCEAALSLGYKVRCLDDLSTGKQANVALFIVMGLVSNMLGYDKFFAFLCAYMGFVKAQCFTPKYQEYNPQ